MKPAILEGGQFALGMTIGLATATVFFLFFGDLLIDGDGQAAIVGALVGGLVTAVVSISLTIMSMLDTRKRSDAQLVLDSFQSFERLFDSLMKTRETIDKYKSACDSVPKDDYSPAGFVVAEDNIIPDDEWRSVREVKNYFKVRYSLVDKGIFSNKALLLSMDRYGVEMMQGVKALDILRFYGVRLKKFKEGRTVGTNLSFQFRNDLVWYERLQEYLEKNGAIFIRD